MIIFSSLKTFNIFIFSESFKGLDFELKQTYSHATCEKGYFLQYFVNIFVGKMFFENKFEFNKS